MNDQLKKYVDDNRDDFDHLEPSPAIFLKLKNELKNKPKEKKGIIRLVVNHKWLVAASILITVSVTYMVLNNKTSNQNSTNQYIAKTKLPANEIPSSKSEKPVYAATLDKPSKIGLKKYTQRTPNAHKQETSLIDITKLYAELADSTSASTRLAAVLKIQKSALINYDIIDKLAKTLNHDSNSNVRLAALNLISEYKHDSYAANMLLQSFVNQKDPLVQLGLIDIFSQTNNPKLDDKLYALANDPTTFSAVKDQAYLVLLNQNKL